MPDLTPVLLSVRMPFYPVQSTYEKRQLHDMQDPALLEAYMAALRREIEAAAPDYEDCEIRALRVGGGIAGHVADESLGVLLRDLHSLFRFEENAPVTITVHPGMVSVDTLTACHRGKVTCLSVDYCTADPFESEAMGRFLPPGVMDTTMLVLENEKLHLSFEIMTGLPGQTENSLSLTLNQVKKYGAGEIVPHPLEMIPGTEFAAQVPALSVSTSPRWHLPAEKERAALWQHARTWCENEGYTETVPGRFSLPGSASKYHQMKMEGMALLGFGAGAKTRMDGVEAENIRNINAYIRFSPDPDKIIGRVSPVGGTTVSG